MEASLILWYVQKHDRIQHHSNLSPAYKYTFVLSSWSCYPRVEIFKWFQNSVMTKILSLLALSKKIIPHFSLQVYSLNCKAIPVTVSQEPPG